MNICNESSAFLTTESQSLQKEWNFNTFKCPLCDCEPLVKNYSKHICSECDKRQVTCSFCSEIVCHENLSRHESNCSIDFVTCPNCDFDLQRKEYKEHVKNCDIVSRTATEKYTKATPKEEVNVLKERVILQDKLIHHLIQKIDSLEFSQEKVQQGIQECKSCMDLSLQEFRMPPIPDNRHKDGTGVNMDIIIEYLRQTHSCMSKFSCLFIDYNKFPDNLKLEPNMMLNSLMKQFYFPSEKVENKKPIIVLPPIYIKLNLFMAKTRLHLDVSFKERTVRGVYEYYHAREGMKLKFGLENLPRSITDKPKPLVNRMMLLLLDPLNQNNVLYLEKRSGDVTFNMNYMMFSDFIIPNKTITQIYNKGFKNLDVILFAFEQFDN